MEQDASHNPTPEQGRIVFENTISLASDLCWGSPVFGRFQSVTK